MASETRKTEPWYAVFLMVGSGLGDRGQPREQKSRAGVVGIAGMREMQGKFYVGRMFIAASARGASLRHVMARTALRVPYRTTNYSNAHCTSIYIYVTAMSTVCRDQNRTEKHDRLAAYFITGDFFFFFFFLIWTTTDWFYYPAAMADPGRPPFCVVSFISSCQTERHGVRS